MSLPKHFFLLLLLISVSYPILGASFPILPEVQVYHTVGSRGSPYSPGALGLSLHLYDEPAGPGRYLHFLVLSIPEKTVAWKGRVGDLFLSKNGIGFEIGVHDQWVTPSGKGATLSLRKIQKKRLYVFFTQNSHQRSIFFTLLFSYEKLLFSLHKILINISKPAFETE